MGLSASDLKKIKTIGINSTILLILVVAGIWFVQYSRLKKQHPDLHGDETGTQVATSTTVIPLDLEAHQLVALRYCETDQPAKAIPHLKRCLVFDPHNRSLRYTLAVANLDAGHYAQALSVFSRLEHEDVSDSLASRICAQKGITLFYLGNLAESQSQLEGCLARFPQSAEAACFLGQIAASRPDGMKTARDYLDKAIMLDSLYVEGWYQRARLAMLEGQYLVARKMLLRALEIDPLHVKSHSRLGMVYYYLHDYAQAKKAYLTALALNPKDFNTRYNLGELYYSHQGDTVSALREFKTALKHNPGHVEANFKVGLICLNNNMIKEAIRYFETARANGTDNVRILLQLAVAYEKLGDKAAALRTYEAAVEVDALNSIARQKIRYLSEDLGNNE